MPGQLEEHVVQRRAAHLDVGQLDVGGVQLPDRLGQRGHPVGHRYRDPPALLVDRRLAGAHPLEDRRDRRQIVAPHRGHLQPLSPDPALELVGGTAGDGHPAVEHHDVVGELVGLLHVLRGQQQGHPLPDPVGDGLPQPEPAVRVEPGGRLVEEDHRRPGHQGTGQVQPAAHAARVGLRGPVGRVGQLEPLQQLGRPRPGLPAAEVVEPADHLQVLLAGQVLVDRRVLPGQPDDLAYLLGMADDVDPGDRGPTGVGFEQRREDSYARGLARAVGPEEPEHRPLGYGQVKSVESMDVVVKLDEAFSLDGSAHRLTLGPTTDSLPPH